MLVLCGVLAGFAIPPTSSVLRSMWPSLLRDRPHLIQPAYALDSVLIELIFILGPLLTGLLTALVAPQVALIVSAVSVIAGTLLFTALPPSRAWQPERDAPSAGPWGALELAGRAQHGADLAARRASASASARSRSRPSATRSAPRSWRACCSRSGRRAAPRAG